MDYGIIVEKECSPQLRIFLNNELSKFKMSCSNYYISYDPVYKNVGCFSADVLFSNKP